MNNIDIEIDIDETTLKELKELQKPLSGWLVHNTTNFEVAAIVLQTVLDKINEIEQRLQNEQ